jgi:ABC-type sugar transport system ATPase subunit
MDIRLDGVRLERQGRTVLAIDSLALPGGRTTAIVGPNGAGKTALLRVVAGLERPSAGRVQLGDRVLDGRPASDRVAFAFQHAVLVRGSVQENLSMALRLRHVPADEQAARIADVARALDIEAILARPSTNISHGEAQRVDLARALALRSPIMLLDEPLASQDAPTRARLVDDLPLAWVAWKPTVVVVTHDRDEAARLADHLVVLVDGRPIAEGDAAALLRSPPSAAAATVLGFTTIELHDRVVAIPRAGLSIGEGSLGLRMKVERVVDAGAEREAVGLVAGVRLRAVVPAAEPSPAAGDEVPINGDVRSFPAGSHGPG